MICGPKSAAFLAAFSSAARTRRSRTSSSPMPSSFAQSATGQIEIEGPLHVLLEPGHVPLLGEGFFRNVLGDEVVDHLAAHVADGLAEIGVGHQLEALLEDRLALIVHHVVVFEQVLADVEVARLDLGLRLLQRLVDPGMDDGLVLLEAERLEHAVHALRAEDAHEVVFAATGRSASGRDRLGGPSGRAAGCRCAGFRGARCR